MQQHRRLTDMIVASEDEDQAQFAAKTIAVGGLGPRWLLERGHFAGPRELTRLPGTTDAATISVDIALTNTR